MVAAAANLPMAEAMLFKEAGTLQSSSAEAKAVVKVLKKRLNEKSKAEAFMQQEVRSAQAKVSVLKNELASEMKAKEMLMRDLDDEKTKLIDLRLMVGIDQGILSRIIELDSVRLARTLAWRAHMYHRQDRPAASGDSRGCLACGRARAGGSGGSVGASACEWVVSVRLAAVCLPADGGALHAGIAPRPQQRHGAGAGRGALVVG